MEKVFIVLISTLIGTSLGILLTCSEDVRYAVLVKKNILYFFIGSLALFILISFYSEDLVDKPVFFISYIGFISGLLLLSGYIDFKLQDLPDRNTLLFFVATVIVSILLKTDFKMLLIRSVIMTIIYSLLSITGGLGFGDVKLLVPITMMTFSIYDLLDFWTYTIVMAMIYVIPLIVYNKVKKRSRKEIANIKFAFGPFIILGFIFTLIF